MKLEPGMYVRINNNIRTICLGIGKIKKIADDTVYVEMGDTLRLPVSFEIKKIYKASHSIIDLIEIGDYVNGYKVTDRFDYLLSFGNDDWFMNEEDIKSIVTKEQFESAMYKVKE